MKIQFEVKSIETVNASSSRVQLQSSREQPEGAPSLQQEAAFQVIVNRAAAREFNAGDVVEVTIAPKPEDTAKTEAVKTE